MSRYELIKTLETLYKLKQDPTQSKRAYKITTPLMSRTIIIKFYLYNWKIYSQSKRTNKKHLLEIMNYYQNIPEVLQGILITYRKFYDKEINNQGGSK